MREVTGDGHTQPEGSKSADSAHTGRCEHGQNTSTDNHDNVGPTPRALPPSLTPQCQAGGEGPGAGQGGGGDSQKVDTQEAQAINGHRVLHPATGVLDFHGDQIQNRSGTNTAPSKGIQQHNHLRFSSQHYKHQTPNRVHVGPHHRGSGRGRRVGYVEPQAHRPNEQHDPPVSSNVASSSIVDPSKVDPSSTSPPENENPKAVTQAEAGDNQSGDTQVGLTESQPSEALPDAAEDISLESKPNQEYPESGQGDLVPVHTLDQSHPIPGQFTVGSQRPVFPGQYSDPNSPWLNGPSPLSASDPTPITSNTPNPSARPASPTARCLNGCFPERTSGYIKHLRYLTELNNARAVFGTLSYGGRPARSTKAYQHCLRRAQSAPAHVHRNGRDEQGEDTSDCDVIPLTSYDDSTSRTFTQGEAKLYQGQNPSQPQTHAPITLSCDLPVTFPHKMSRHPKHYIPGKTTRPLGAIDGMIELPGHAPKVNARMEDIIQYLRNQRRPHTASLDSYLDLHVQGTTPGQTDPIQAWGFITRSNPDSTKHTPTPAHSIDSRSMTESIEEEVTLDDVEEDEKGSEGPVSEDLRDIYNGSLEPWDVSDGHVTGGGGGQGTHRSHKKSASHRQSEDHRKVGSQGHSSSHKDTDKSHRGHSSGKKVRYVINKDELDDEEPVSYNQPADYERNTVQLLNYYITRDSVDASQGRNGRHAQCHVSKMNQGRSSQGQHQGAQDEDISARGSSAEVQGKPRLSHHQPARSVSSNKPGRYFMGQPMRSAKVTGRGSSSSVAPESSVEGESPPEDGVDFPSPLDPTAGTFMKINSPVYLQSRVASSYGHQRSGHIMNHTHVSPSTGVLGKYNKYKTVRKSGGGRTEPHHGHHPGAPIPTQQTKSRLQRTNPHHSRDRRMGWEDESNSNGFLVVGRSMDQKRTGSK